MARLFIYDSNATEDAAGNAVAMSLSNDVYRTTQPVRLYGCVDGPVNDIGYEVLFEGDRNVSSAAPVELYWYQEFYNDAPSRGLPSARVATGVSPMRGWSREQLQYADGTLVSPSTVLTQIEHYDIRRHVILADGVTYFADENTRARLLYFPVSVHAYFTRLKLAVHTLPAGTFRLRVWAVVGGQDQQTAQEALTVPYAAEL